MGLFSGSKEIYVSSSVYNLAGDIKNRIRYLPTLIAGHVLVDSGKTLTQSIQDSLLNGPGIRMRKFGQWARNSGYRTAIGFNATRLRVDKDVDQAVLQPFLPAPVRASKSVQYAVTGMADYSYWVEQWICQNMPSKINADYRFDFDEDLNVMAIYFSDGNVSTFSPANYDPYGDYLYAAYTYTVTDVSGPIVVGTEVGVAASADLPSTGGYTFNGSTSAPLTVPLNTVVDTTVTYSDSTPSEHTTSTSSATGNFNRIDALWIKETFAGQGGTSSDELYSEKEYLHHITSKKVVSSSNTVVTTEDIGNGVIKTTTKVTTTESLQNYYGYQVDTQQNTLKKWSSLQIFIYKKGSGNTALDYQFGEDWEASGSFFPPIPIRMNGQTLSSSYRSGLFKWSKKAYERATGAKLPDLIKSLHKNIDIGDIDYAYAVFGVSLNTPDKSGKRYIYEFFKYLYDSAALVIGPNNYAIWKAAWQSADASRTRWANWKQAQGNPADPLYGTAEPSFVAYPAMPGLRLNTTAPSINYNITVNSTGLGELNGTGLGRPGAKPGDCWLVRGSPESYKLNVFAGSTYDYAYPFYLNNIENTAVTVYHQLTADTYTAITVYSIGWTNIIYQGKRVVIGAMAMDQSEESAFIVPLHEEVFRRMSLVESTQMSFANAYLLFNSYEEVKQKWYQTDFFKFILIVVVIVVSIYTGGAAAGGGAGILGSSAAVGAALGFAGTLALIVGTLANAIAAFLLSKVIMMASTKLFGEKLGLIIGTIASIIALNVGTSMANGGSMATGFSNMTRADNLTKLTLAAGDAYSKYVQSTTAATLEESQQIWDDYLQKSEEVTQMWEQTFGFGDVYFDPLNLTSVFKPAVMVSESPDSFLSRTLMTGNDIADLSLDMLTNFADTTLQTNLPI